MKKRSQIYKEHPRTVTYFGHRYVLAEEDSKAEEEAPEEEKKKGTRAARLRIDESKGTGILFDIEALVHSYDGVGIPGLTDAAEPVRGRKFKIRHVHKLRDIPKDALRRIEEADNGEAIIKRIERYLKVRPSPPLYFVEGKGGWQWGKKGGDRDVEMIQGLLDYLRGRGALLYSYCDNRMEYGDKKGLI
jgi:hypothetical protein